jgi:hypothetical protein
MALRATLGRMKLQPLLPPLPYPSPARGEGKKPARFPLGTISYFTCATATHNNSRVFHVNIGLVLQA